MSEPLPMTDQRAERCETCRFWERETFSAGDDTDDMKPHPIFGRCLRFPPRIGEFDPDVEDGMRLEREYVATAWPVTVTTQWCGEWRGRGVAPHVDLSASVDVLDLSVRADTCLNHLGVRTLGQLVQYPASVLLRERNFGHTTLDEVRRKLAALGLRLAGDPEPAG